MAVKPFYVAGEWRTGEGTLEVPMTRTYPLERALDAAKLLLGRHPGGKVALLPAHSATQGSAAT